MQNNYLIPANTKKSQLIFGFFTKIDLIIFIVGVVLSFIMLIFIKTFSIWVILLIMLPALIAGFLVLPLPHYHNILQLLTNIVNFYFGRRQYYWKGWNMYEEFRDSNK